MKQPSSAPLSATDDNIGLIGIMIPPKKPQSSSVGRLHLAVPCKGDVVFTGEVPANTALYHVVQQFGIQKADQGNGELWFDGSVPAQVLSIGIDTESTIIEGFFIDTANQSAGADQEYTVTIYLHYDD